MCNEAIGGGYVAGDFQVLLIIYLIFLLSLIKITNTMKWKSFHENYKRSKLTQEKSENINTPMTKEEMEQLSEIPPKKEGGTKVFMNHIFLTF